MDTLAVLLREPERLELDRLDLSPPGAADVVVDVEWSGISTGTERLLWSGRMPDFPGMGYPLVPGYESVGRVAAAGPDAGRRVGERVFVAGARCFGPVRGLFGGAASRLVVPGARALPVGDDLGERGVLLALAATAWHAIAAPGAAPPDLVVGHGVLGRLLARLAPLAGGAGPTVWETDARRAAGAAGYAVLDPADDPRRDYRAIYDASGDPSALDGLIARLAPGGEVVLAGFYAEPLRFAFPPAFMREARLRVAAEWRGPDLAAVAGFVAGFVADGRLSLDGLITHRRGRGGGAGRLPHRVRRPGLPENGPRLEENGVNASVGKPPAPAASAQATMHERLRAEAAAGDDGPAPAGEGGRKAQVIAIYGKGGIGKSFTLANLSYMMAQQGKRVLLIGCDPKSDTTSLLFGGRSCPTIIETSSRKKAAGEQVAIGNVCFKRDGVFAMELGGPEVGRGCGGRGIIHGFELLEKLGFHQWDFDYVLLDFLGDVVCGGFGLPIARDMCQKVIVVGSNDLQSRYVANNVCSAVEYFKKLGGNVGVAGMVVNKDDGTGEAAAFAERAGIPVLAAIPADEDIRRKSASYEIVGKPGGRWAPLFEALAVQVAEAPPRRPTPLTHEALLDLFKGETVGRGVVLDPATMEDMCAAEVLNKPSLEVVYDGA